MTPRSVGAGMRLVARRVAQERAALEVTAGALPADASGGGGPGAVDEPGFELTERDGGGRNRRPGTGAMQREDADPGAGDGAVEAGEVVGGETAGGDEVREAEVGEVGDAPIVFEGGHDDVVVTAGGEVVAGAVEAAARGMSSELVGPGESDGAAERHAGADGGAEWVFVAAKAGDVERVGELLGVAEVAECEQ